MVRHRRASSYLPHIRRPPMPEPATPARALPRLLRLALALLLIASGGAAARADDGMIDVHTLPRPDGAEEDGSRPDPYRVVYRVPVSGAAAMAATSALLSADGWVRYTRPLDERSSTLTFKKGRQGLTVYATAVPGGPDKSALNYLASRIYANLPFPDGASDLVFDEA